MILLPCDMRVNFIGLVGKVKSSFSCGSQYLEAVMTSILIETLNLRPVVLSIIIYNFL